jgi:hypothetical protein
VRRNMEKVTLEEIREVIENKLFVETKDSKVIPFFLNTIQESFFAQLIKFAKHNPGRPLRVIILKGRQFGFSTLILAWFYIKCLMVENTRAAVVSHEGEATKKLFRRVRFFAKTTKSRPTLDKESEKEYSFPRTNSYFYIGTAGAKAFGRGDNLTDVHCSEVAFWESPGIVMTGLLQAVGMTGNVIIETTANGVGNYFYKLWQKSYRNAKSAWLAIFFKWTKFKEYEMEVPEDFKRTAEEQDICDNHPDMNNKKLMWRRWKISETEADEGFTPEQIFMQEYPLEPREAFIHSGRAVFNIGALESQKPKSPIEVIDAEGLVGQIFKYHEPSGYSVAGIDVSEGLENNDRHVLDIYNEHLEQALHLACWGDIDEFAYWCIYLMRQYNSFCVPEVNGPGIKLMGHLKEGVYKDGEVRISNYPIHKIYRREEFDRRTREKKEVPGWRTTVPTRNILVPTLAQYVREMVIKFNQPETIDECMSFVKNKVGKAEAIEGANDDRVFAAGLAVQGYIDKPPKFNLLTPEAIAKMEKDKLNKDWRKNKLKKIKKKRRRLKKTFK